MRGPPACGSYAGRGRRIMQQRRVVDGPDTQQRRCMAFAAITETRPSPLRARRRWRSDSVHDKNGSRPELILALGSGVILFS